MSMIVFLSRPLRGSEICNMPPRPVFWRKSGHTQIVCPEPAPIFNTGFGDVPAVRLWLSPAPWFAWPPSRNPAGGLTLPNALIAFSSFPVGETRLRIGTRISWGSFRLVHNTGHGETVPNHRFGMIARSVLNRAPSADFRSAPYKPPPFNVVCSGRLVFRLGLVRFR